VRAEVAGQLELAVPVVPWHTIRTRPARLAGSLGAALGTMGKIAGDVVLLAQTEVAEAREGGAEDRGGSSAMPHKRNPVTAAAILACAQQGPGLVSTVLSAMAQEHERATGRWQGEWLPLAQLLELAGSAAAAARQLLSELEIDPDRMRADIAEPALSERVSALLAQSIDPSEARRLVQAAARDAASQGRSFRELLLELSEVRDGLGADGVDRALTPEGYLGVAQQLIDRALAAHRGE
jgi:3-carboxy-cis,cis-muconate cycloisomerase